MSAPSTPHSLPRSLPLASPVSHTSTSSSGVDSDSDATELQVLLPSISNSFSLNLRVPLSGTVQDVKRSISEQCPGNPKATGQRIIWKGRVVEDEEVVGDIWKRGEDPHTIHLAVHPSSWTTAPPRSPRREAGPLPTFPQLDRLPATTPTPLVGGAAPHVFLGTAAAQHATRPFFPRAFSVPHLQFPPLPTGVSPHLPPLYIRFLHQNALYALMGQSPQAWIGSDGLLMARIMTRAVFLKNRIGWSDAFVEGEELGDPKDPNDLELNGAMYEQTVVDGLPYLSLLSPALEPSIRQKKALSVLTYTLPILHLLPYMSYASPSPTAHSIFHHHQQAQNAALQAALGQIQDVAARAPRRRQIIFPFNMSILINAIVPLCLVFIRAGFFVLFFPPAQKPIWAVCVAAWVAYEAMNVWRRARDAHAEANRPIAGRPRRNRQGADGGAADGGQQQPPQPAQNRPNPLPAYAHAPPALAQPVQYNQAAARTAHLTTLADRLAYFNLEEEGKALGIPFNQPTPSTQIPIIPPENEASSPSFMHQVATFGVLFIVSLVPVLWSRRAAKIREREREIKRIFADKLARPPLAGGTEGQNTEDEDVGKRRREALGGWRRRYVERVIGGDVPEEGEM